MTPEGKVKAAVKKLLKSVPGVYSHWPVQTGYGAPTLDCTGAIRSGLYGYVGVAFAIETKAPGKKATPRQLLTVSQLEAAGVAVFLIGERVEDGEYSGMAALERWLRQHHAGPR
ncbi:MAG: hypothetical protein HC793_00375 [Aquincola sp.]|nr:hypothetical protein [Aquincola sp.]